MITALIMRVTAVLIGLAGIVAIATIFYIAWTGYVDMGRYDTCHREAR